MKLEVYFVSLVIKNKEIQIKESEIFYLRDKNISLVNWSRTYIFLSYFNSTIWNRFCSNSFHKNFFFYLSKVAMDGGSPLSCHTNGRYELTGLVTFGTSCPHDQSPSLFTHVSKFSKWIRKNYLKLKRRRWLVSRNVEMSNCRMSNDVKTKYVDTLEKRIV